MAIISCRSLIVAALALAAVTRATSPTSTGLEYDPVLPARQPVPSQVQSTRRSLRGRALNTLSGSELAAAICPNDLNGCPIAKPGSLSSVPASFADWQKQGFECVDLNADLKDCGGCASLRAEHDCTAIAGAYGISCVAGSCVVHSCLPGYTLDSDENICVQD
ncbi:hypothetical protein GALMADRAFT_132344 [Galerina marginata CBS 339.88]|uniref:Protein CPL1-like domain-containing protein n=1 Tax=Galerina marginata (strain CBS 339.88) TaxID=685588 RepID=A0A067TR37_GALM3|nr:hypothetical protein GALMADRAFT_132344 [Galerina marginata CBS 339.88]